MNIAIDARAAREVPAGRGRVVRELLESLARLQSDHRFTLYSRQEADQLELDERFEWKTIERPDPAWHVAAARDANRSCDAFLSTNSYLTVWFLRIPSAMVVYDMVAFIKGAIPQRRAQAIERLTLGWATRRVDRVICISEATERDLLQRYPRLRGRSTVVPLAPSRRFDKRSSAQEVAAICDRYGLGRSFVLSVGVLDPRKNLRRLIAAYAGLPAGLRKDRRLVMVGPKGPEMDRVLEAADLHSSDVTVLGYVPDEDLVALYSGCDLFCYPSLYEGFGLPVVEALRCGVPVITSRVSSLPEVGGDAVEYVDPLDVDDMRAAMVRLLESSERRAELGRRGPAQASQFTWEQTAQGVLDVLEDAAGMGRAALG